MKNSDADFSDIFEDVFEKVFGAARLSKDLTKAKSADSDKIGDAILYKLSYDSVDKISECVANFQDEIRDYLFVSFERNNVDKSKKDEVVDFVSGDSQDSKNARIAMDTLRELVTFDEEYGDDYHYLDHDEFCASLLSWVTTLNRIRATGDLIPMVTRAVYQDKVRDAINVWFDNKDTKNSDSEDFWQKELSQNLEVLERIIGSKVLLVSEQPNFGGQDIDGKGGKIPDFALESVSTNNLVIVEIKKPGAKLLGRKYRGGVYGFSADLSGAISQVLVQRNQIMNSFYEKKYTSNSSFEVHKPKCIVITGNSEKELKGDTDKCRSFELLRNTVEPDVVIKTFDELYANYISFNEANEI
ncbi:Shedu immune nuclease family protein [Vibrio campbellii]|uniref:Shedu immune nuclease family protein n=1 Tax=Vibrio campbellii TaxID=680 RepID=UPI00249C14E5|nr:Shedu immune nuclease family protein [Vibrio campbellii]